MRALIRPASMAHRVAVVRIHGVIRGPELLRLMRAPLEDPAWAPGFSVVWDARAIRVLDLAPEDLPPFEAQ